MTASPTKQRKLRVERLEDRVVLATQSWNLAADFAADFVGGLPQNNPNGTWDLPGKSDGDNHFAQSQRMD